jgi:hypothetical protein
MPSKIYGSANPGGEDKRVAGKPPLAPTPHLRWWVMKPYTQQETGLVIKPKPILQQWWAPDVPSYMIKSGDGEWREVEQFGE